MMMKAVVVVLVAVVAVSSALDMEKHHADVHRDLTKLEQRLSPTRIFEESAHGDDAALALSENLDANQANCRMDIEIVVDLSGSISKYAEVLKYSRDFYTLFRERFTAINLALKAKGIRMNRARTYGYAASARYFTDKNDMKDPYRCFTPPKPSGALCGGNTHTLDALILAMTHQAKPKDKTKRTILLITDGIANPSSQDPKDYIENIRKAGHNILIVFIGTSSTAAVTIETYTNTQAGMGGFMKYLICPDGKCKTDKAEDAADAVIDELCVQGSDMFVHYKYAQSKFNGGQCKPHPVQSAEIAAVTESLTRGSCQMESNKVYCVGRFSGAVTEGNKKLAIARAKNCRSVFKSEFQKQGWDDSKFKIAWGVVGDGTEDGECAAQRVDLFCGENNDSVEIPEELQWEVVE